MKNKILVLISLLALLAVACEEEHLGYDAELSDFLAAENIDLNEFRLPDYGDYGAVPQSMDNEVTADKVKLGASIFWDPVWLQNGVLGSDGIRTASCGSCHIKDGHVGQPQGIGEGGASTGLANGQRRPNLALGAENLDGQPRRAPTNMHVAYKPNVLWDGLLGSPDLSRFRNMPEFIRNNNQGVSVSDELVAEIHDLREFESFAGAEMQGLLGLTAHRMRVNESIIDSAGSQYKPLFDRVFGPGSQTSIYNLFGGLNNEFFYTDPSGQTYFIDFGINVKDSQGNIVRGSDGNPIVTRDTVVLHYSKLAAAMAIAAYNRHIVADDAPFQQYIRGNTSAMTTAQKRGFRVFIESGCINCHRGPALTDADFHVMGTQDLSSEITGNLIAGDSPFEQGVDIGRQNATGREEDRYAFLTPTIYNVPEHVFHGGVSGGASAAVNYMLNRVPAQNNGIMDNSWRDNSGISDQERSDLIKFVDEALRDNNYDYKYRPGHPGGLLDPVFSADNLYNDQICSPNSDAQSEAGLGVFCN